MLMILAMLAQGAMLDGDPVRAAMTCSAVSSAGARTPSSAFDSAVRHTYFSMEAVRADPATAAGSFLPQVEAVQKKMLAHAQAVRPDVVANTAALQAECDRRYPLARATGPVTLPVDPLQSDLLCMGSTGLLAGIAKGIEEGALGSLEHDRLPLTFLAYANRFTDARRGTAHIADDAQLQIAVGEALRKSLDLGNLEQIGHACAAVPAQGDMVVAVAPAEQAVTLDTDPARAATTCAAVAVANASDSFDEVIAAHHLILVAARSTPGAGDLLDRSNGTSREVGRNHVSREDAGALRPQCVTRFPLAWSKAPATLAVAPGKRSLMCLATAAALQGAVQDHDQPGLAALAARVLAKSEVAVTTVLRGKDQAAASVLIDKAFAASLDFGNMLAVTTACDTAPIG